MKKILGIGSSDCSGGAGIQADLKTFAAHGLFGMAVITAVVAENTVRLFDKQNIDVEIIEKQIDAVFEDIVPDAVKVGMLSCTETINIVAKKLGELRPNNLVIDPVMYAKNGCPLMAPDAIEALVTKIVPLADVLTPNVPEAEKMAGMNILDFNDLETAARIIKNKGCKNVLITGVKIKAEITDLLYDGEHFYYYTSPRLNSNTYGSGTTIASAIAAYLAYGFTLPRAVKKAKIYGSSTIENAIQIGKGSFTNNHMYDIYKKGLVESEFEILKEPVNDNLHFRP